MSKEKISHLGFFFLYLLSQLFLKSGQVLGGQGRKSVPGPLIYSSKHTKLGNKAFTDFGKQKRGFLY